MGSEIVIVPVVFATIGFVVWILVLGYSRRQQIRGMTEFQSRLLERMGSVKDFSDFLATDGGAKFIDRMTAGGARPEIRVTILRSLQTGLVLFALGVGLIMLPWILRNELRYGDTYGFTVSGTIALSLGFGFLLSAGAAYRFAGSIQRRNDE
ncbi:MAG TPA: hypothetical protein VFZ98_08815 [Vicinamibacterales bacterium]